MRPILSVAALLLSCHAGFAQAATDIGLTITVPNQRFGAICAPVSCQPVPASVGSGLSFAVTSWGTFGNPYVVLVSPTASSCIPVGPIHHALVLGSPLLVLRGGTLSQGLAGVCVTGNETFNVNVPLGTRGATFGMQAVTLSPVGLSFTNALLVTVQ